MKIGLLRSSVNGKDCIDNGWSEALGKDFVQFRSERGTSDGQQQFPVDFPVQLEVVQKLEYNRQLIA